MTSSDDNVVAGLLRHPPVVKDGTVAILGLVEIRGKKMTSIMDTDQLAEL